MLFVPVLALLVAAAVLLRIAPARAAARRAARAARVAGDATRAHRRGTASGAADRRHDLVAISVGVALFSLNYRQTLVEQVSAAAD